MRFSEVTVLVAVDDGVDEVSLVVEAVNTEAAWLRLIEVTQRDMVLHPSVGSTDPNIAARMAIEDERDERTLAIVRDEPTTNNEGDSA